MIEDELRRTLIEPLLPRPGPRGKSDPGRPRGEFVVLCAGGGAPARSESRWVSSIDQTH
ncbi:hypothetical protein BN2475_420031 [Paraburkholderia ribeironis]|uniref:Uncharacterized protein n=1 Tax=Paraburkholderia ribeironis TaxID=1247936 RepID=A0A1N7S765_9BURK|nr:hypothetical protein BN2475_420031 [Paraburkholderia ribeironis]